MCCASALTSHLTSNQVYKKLERELHEKKRDIASVIDVSNIAYEARDQARRIDAAGWLVYSVCRLFRPRTRLRRCGRKRTRSRPCSRRNIVRCGRSVVLLLGAH